MSNLDNAIKDVAYILDSLMALRNIHQTGSCNECGAVKTCGYVPKPGQMVRYNCPFYVGRPDDTEDEPKIDGGTVADFVAYLNRELPKWYARQPFDDLMYAVRKVAKDFIEEYGE